MAPVSLVSSKIPKLALFTFLFNFKWKYIRNGCQPKVASHVSHVSLPQMQTPPGCRPNWMHTPLPWIQTPNPLDAEPPHPAPRCRHPPGHMTCDACWEKPPPPNPVDRMTDACGK